MPGSVGASVREALLDAAAIVLPTACAGCGRPDRSLCDRCRRELEPRVRRVRPSGEGFPVVAALDYDGAARAALLAFKDGDRTGLAGPLGVALGAAATAALASARDAAPGSAFTWVAVPSRRSAVRRRGYRPVVVLAGRAGIRVVPLLRAVRGAEGRRAQKALGRDDREANVRGMLRARGPLAGRRVLLLDDVVTTGATVREAARALRDAGAEVVAAAVVAATPRRHPGPLAAARGAPPGVHEPPSGFVPGRW